MVPVGGGLWVVDEVQPVAAVLDVETGALITTVGWPEVPPPVRANRRSGWLVRPAADGLWVQQPEGPLGLVTTDGLRSGHLTAGPTLGAVSAHGAVCLPDPAGQGISSGDDPPPRRGGGIHQLLVAHPEHPTASVYVDSPVHGAGSCNGDLYLQVESGQWDRRYLGSPDSWIFEPVTSWLRLPADRPLPDRLSLSTHRSDAPPDRGPSAHTGSRQPASLWLEPPGSSTPASATPATAPPGGIVWRAGWDRGTRTRKVIAVASDPVTSAELLRIPLGDGAVRATTAIAALLWIAIEGPRHLATCSKPAPTRLMRVHADGGAVDTVLAPDAVDVTEHCWPLPPEPIDGGDYVAFWRNRLSDLEHYWTHPDGARGPLSRGLGDSEVEVVGSWPDTELHVTFSYARRPGRRLRRTVPLFDELGRPTAPEYAAIHLMEDLDTGNIPADGVRGADHLDV